MKNNSDAKSKRYLSETFRLPPPGLGAETNNNDALCILTYIGVASARPQSDLIQESQLATDTNVRVHRSIELSQFSYI